MPKTISICIPVFNESGNIICAIEEVEQLFEEELSHYRLELIVTDNASTDNTWETLRTLADDRPHLKAFRFSKNFGYQNSVFAGLSLSTGDAVIELDADLEDPPQIIPRFVEKWEQGYDVVYGVRNKRYGPWLLRMLTSLFYRVMGFLSEERIPGNAGDFRLLDRKVVSVLVELPERNLYLRGLVSFLGFRQTPLTYDRQPRLSGKSKFRLFSYILVGLDGITAFSKRPLRFIGFMGLILFFFSMALATWYLVKHLMFGVVLPGFTTLVILLLVLHSMTFIFLGILGEYLSRIFDDAKHRPRVIIAESIHAEDPPRFL